MWTCITFIFLIPAVIVTMQILSPQETHVPDSDGDELRGIARRPLTSKLEVI
jgi:hypothetical protein